MMEKHINVHGEGRISRVMAWVISHTLTIIVVNLGWILMEATSSGSKAIHHTTIDVDL